MSSGQAYQASLFSAMDNLTDSRAVLDARIEAFLATTSADFYQPEDIIDWSYVEDRLESLSDAIENLADFCNSSSYGHVDGLSKLLLRSPRAIEVIGLCMSFPPTLEMSDGRTIPSYLPIFVSPAEVSRIAHLLEDIGVWNFFKVGAPISELVKVALVSRDAERRRFRRSASIEQRLEHSITDACASIEADSGLAVDLVAKRDLPDHLKRKVDYVIKIDHEPVAAIVTVMQMTLGGRQQRDLRQTFPLLQQELNDIPMKLILIADGLGIKKTPKSVLSDLFDSVFSVMSINQARQGILAQTLMDAYQERSIKSALPIALIIESYLAGGKSVHISDLPTDTENARIAIAGYAQEHPHLDLMLTENASKLEWKRTEIVSEAVSIQNNFLPDLALQFFCDVIRAQVLSWDESRTRCVATINALPHLPGRVLIIVQEGRLDDAAIADAARRGVMSDSQLVVVLYDRNAYAGDNKAARLSTQSKLARNVILIDTAMLTSWTMSTADPVDAFAKEILTQADLAKISPFVWQGPTPFRMYFGRSREEATITSILASNSVAVLGSRRTGKTSLLRRLAHNLNELEHCALFADCQTVQDWQSFGEIIAREWQVEVRHDFRPANLIKIVDELRDRSSKNLIIILDEVDQLLAWDMQHSDETVSEAFFRSCRAISNSGRAQFVFSGERTIATRLSDPHSPHWNFCQPLRLQQLDRESTISLVVSPLDALQVRIEDPSEFSEKVWAYTSGHPQIAQFLGDNLVRCLNQRISTERTLLSSQDIINISDTFEYRNHYVQTYWGQAELIERLITLLIISGKVTITDLSSTVIADRPIGVEQTLKALDMLKLYGIVDQGRERLALKASWFSEAITCYGPILQQLAQIEASLV